MAKRGFIEEKYGLFSNMPITTLTACKFDERECYHGCLLSV